MFKKDNYSVETLGIFLLLASSFIQGTSGIWVKLTGRGLDIFPNIFLRSLIAILFCALLILLLKVKVNKIDKIHQKGALLMTMSFLVANTFYTFSVLNTKVALTTFSYYSSSFISSLVVGRFLLNEKLSLVKIIALGLALLGVYTFANKNGTISLDFGVACGLISGLIIPITNMYRKKLAHHLNFIVIITLPYLGSLVSSFLLSLIFKQNLSAVIFDLKPIAFLGAFLYAVVLVFGNILVIFGIKKVELYLGTLALSTNIIFSALYGFILLNERLSISEVVGGCFIILAIILPSIYSKYTNRKASLLSKIKNKFQFKKSVSVTVPLDI